MKRSAVQAFTLIEMLMVMVIIAIIASLIVGVAGLANRKAMAGRTKGEIDALSTACERYKADNGAYPRLPGTTEPSSTGGGTFLDAQLDGDCTTDKYKASSLFLYQQLSGDANADGRVGDDNATVYFDFKPTMMGGVSTSKPIGTPNVVTYLQDPYGFSYGYSTVGAYDEEDYRQRASTDTTGKATRNKARGYNSNFDFWSTTGLTVDPPTDLTRQKWVKNW